MDNHHPSYSLFFFSSKALARMRFEGLASLFFLLLSFSHLPGGHAVLSAKEQKDEDKRLFCGGSVSSPLSTKYFFPFYESSRSTVGCSCVPRPGEMPVHVVKLNNSRAYDKDIILLTVIDHGEYPKDKGMVLILLSNHPVHWRISIITSNHLLLKNKHTVILSADSNIVEKNFRIHNLQQVQEPFQRLSIETIQDYVERYWGTMTTYTSVGGAHRIKIALPPIDTLSEVCNLNSTSPNPGVESFFIEKKEASGCYHAELAGTSEFDVYLIDLESAGNSSLTPYNATVYLSLNPDISLSEEGAALNRDLILVLKSSQPVRWLLQSTDLIGKLMVISNGDNVEDFSLASSQRLKIIKRSLPSSMTAASSSSLLTEVTTGSSSSVVSYIKVDLANVLTLVIPPRSKRGLASIYDNEDVVLPSEFSRVHGKGGSDRSIIIPEKAGGSPFKSDYRQEYNYLKSILQASMSKDCNQKKTSVAFPRSIMKEYNISRLTLNDPSCQGTTNETHVTLKSMGTSCGSLNYFSGQHPMLKNNVRVHLMGESSARPVLRIPFNCRFKTGFPGFSSKSSKDEEADLANEEGNDGLEEKDYYDDGQEGDEEMYELHVSRAMSGFSSRPPHFQSLAKEFGQSARLSTGDVIKVQTSFETRALLNLALERCWLADHSSPDSELLLKEDLWLIWDGCPAHENITAFSTSGGRNPAFAFKISKEIEKMKTFYIFCVLGLCSPMDTPNNANLKKCMDPSSTCNESDSPHVGPTALQLSRRGPFFIEHGANPSSSSLPELAHGNTDYHHTSNPAGVDYNHQIWSSSIRDKKMAKEDPALDSPNSGLRSSHVIMVGVPTEVAVAISIASFIIGASLTGILCCLHHKKMIPKESTRRNMQELRHLNGMSDVVVSDQNGELQSMLQSPATVQI